MIAVYGANGFIGRALLEALAAAGLRVRAVSRRFDPALTARLGGAVDFVEGDFANSLPMVYTLQDVEAVVQLISTSSPGLQNLQSISDIRDNVIPHVSFLQSCVEAGVRRYVFVSSGGTVYGTGHASPIPESAETNPISSHGLTKLTIEKYIGMHAQVDGLDHVILRVSNPFGPGQSFRKGQGLIPALIDRHMQGLPARIIGTGQAQRDYVYIGDLAEAILAALSLPGHPRETLNIGSGEGRTVLEVVEAIEALSGLALGREFVPARRTDVDVSVLDVRRAAEVLGWRPRTAFHDGLRQTLAAGGLIR